MNMDAFMLENESTVMIDEYITSNTHLPLLCQDII